MRTEARCALVLSIALLTVAGCEKQGTTGTPPADAADTAPGATATAIADANTAGPNPGIEDFARAWVVNRTVGDSFNCVANETKPCHFGHAEDETPDASEWSIRLRGRTGTPGACLEGIGDSARQFDLTAFKSTPGAQGSAPATTTVGFGVMCEDTSTTAMDVVGTPKFGHGGSNWKAHFLRMTLVKKDSVRKPFKMRIEMHDQHEDAKDASGSAEPDDNDPEAHLHAGTGHAED